MPAKRGVGGNPAWTAGKSGNPLGRPKGSKGLLSLLTEKERAKLAAKGITPLEFLLSVVRDSKAPMDMRVQAASCSAPYMHRKMPIAIEGGDPTKPVVFEVTALQGLSVADKMIMLSLFEKMALGQGRPQIVDDRRKVIEAVARTESESESESDA